MNADPYLYQPREVSIETLALCNASCSFCPYPTLERRGTKLSDTDLLALIGQMKAYTAPFVISPFKVNEPFLDKRFFSFCNWIMEDLPLARLRIFTNGSRFNAVNSLDVLALPRVEHIWISLNESDPDRYKELMGLGFEHTCSKIDIFYDAWLRAIKHRVIISRVCEVDPQLEEVRREQFNRFVGRRWGGFVPFHIKRDGWLGFTDPQINTVPKTPCARWWELSITATGEAALCCMDGKAEFSLGNIREKSLDAIYNDPRLLRKRLGMEKRGDTHPCNACTY